MIFATISSFFSRGLWRFGPFGRMVRLSALFVKAPIQSLISMVEDCRSALRIYGLTFCFLSSSSTTVPGTCHDVHLSTNPSVVSLEKSTATPMGDA
jgi:hypothetical protein